jgi:hypothetical protein
VGQTPEHRVLLAIELTLFGILVTLLGGAVIGFVIGLFALLIAASSTSLRPRS